MLDEKIPANQNTTPANSGLQKTNPKTNQSGHNQNNIKVTKLFDVLIMRTKKQIQFNLSISKYRTTLQIFPNINIVVLFF